MPGSKTTVSNMNIAQLADRLAAYIAEIEGCQSKDHTMVSDADLGRIRTYIGSVDSVLKYIESAPELDMPNYDPTLILLKPVPDPVGENGFFENSHIQHISRLFRGFHNEVTSGNSARMVSGIDANELARYKTYTANALAYIDGPVTDINPGDLPETGGSTGVDASNA